MTRTGRRREEEEEEQEGKRGEGNSKHRRGREAGEERKGKEKGVEGGEEERWEGKRESRSSLRFLPPFSPARPPVFSSSLV